MKNILHYISLLFVVLLYAAPTALAAEKWELKKEEDGIKIYTRTVANSPYKALRAAFSMKGTADILEDILLDISRQKDWVYSTKASSTVSRNGAHELIYYSEKSMPWPITNRDAVIRITVNRSSAGMLVSAVSVDGVVPAKEGIIRVPFSKVTWKVTANGDNMLNIDYEAIVDPGGSLPAWVVNMFSTKGPLETFKSLRAISEKKIAGK